MDVKFRTILAHGCHIGVAYGYQQLHMLERKQVLIAKVKHQCLEPLVAISGNTRGVKKALRGEAPSRRVPVIVIVPKSLENKKFNFYDGEGSHLKETGFSEL